MTDTTSTDRIVVGVDGSEPSIDALRYADRIATALNAPLEAVIAWTYPPITGSYLVIETSPQHDAAEILDTAVGRAFGDRPPEGLKRTVVAGPAARTLIEASRTSAMLVLGSRGHGGFAGLLLGSVSAACAEHAACPVLIVHDRQTAAGGEAAGTQES